MRYREQRDGVAPRRAGVVPVRRVGHRAQAMGGGVRVQQQPMDHLARQGARAPWHPTGCQSPHRWHSALRTI